jgi:hypothetical protein
MRFLIGCERSGVVREAYRKRGYDAWSCDLYSTEIPGQHIQGDIVEVAYWGIWGCAIFFPPCTHLTVSGARWFKDKKTEKEKAVEFFMKLANAPILKIAIENPIGIMSTRWRKPDQIIQPYEYGHGETKATCIWVKNLPLLKPTNIVSGREHRIHKMLPSKDRGYLRSITFQGIANAMAEQWGDSQ